MIYLENDKKKITKFPKGFFTSIKPCKINHSKNLEEEDLPFEWSENVLNGKSKVKLVSAKRKTNK